MLPTTKEDTGEAQPVGSQRPVPGLLLVFSNGEPRHAIWRLGNSDGEKDEQLILGRDELLARGVHDERVSRQHVRIDYSAKDGTLSLRDLGSRNGSVYAGEPLPPNIDRRVDKNAPRALRIGKTLLLPMFDIRPHERYPLTVRDGVVIGALLREAQEHVAMLSRAGHNVLILGESGVGKEHLARVYHATATSPGETAPFVAINCATIPRELAERLLFGTRRGAYSGAAADADGYVTAAHGGTLFLDEIAELDTSVQAKLLRVLETKQVLPLGATRPQEVKLRLCAATLRDLRAEVPAGRFREDLYFRIGQPEVRLPPLRDRAEEIPWLCQLALQRDKTTAQLAMGLSLVETCLSRPWQGNVRELLAEVHAAALLATARKSTSVEQEHLSPRAGLLISRGPAAAAPPPTDKDQPLPQSAQPAQAALDAESGNVVRAAERLGISRAKLRRLIDKYGLTTKRG